MCALLASAERYIQYKCTKSLVQRVLEFVDNHGNEVLSLGSFALLPEHVVRLILSREELKAEELIKFQAALQWSQRYCDGSPGTADLREVRWSLKPHTFLLCCPLGCLGDSPVKSCSGGTAALLATNRTQTSTPSPIMPLPLSLSI